MTESCEPPYFAYGSNLDQVRLEDRTNEVPDWRRAVLRHYRLAFNKRGQDGGVYANIVPAAGGIVWGVIYSCSPQALDRLDQKEGVEGGHYHRAPIMVSLEDGTDVEAMTYVAGQEHVVPEQQPNRTYLQHILEGARAHGLPEDYVRMVQELGRGRGLA